MGMNCEWRDILDYWGATVHYCSRDGTECYGKCEHYKEFKINEK